MWSPSRSWTFLLDSEDCLSELKSNRKLKRKQRQAELIMCEVWRWFKSPCLVTLVALEANQSLVAMWCRIITASQQSCYSVGRGMDMRGWTPSLGDTLCCARFHTCFHALKRKIWYVISYSLVSRIFKNFQNACSYVFFLKAVILTLGMLTKIINLQLVNIILRLEPPLRHEGFCSNCRAACW